jgi:purine nucleosidase
MGVDDAAAVAWLLEQRAYPVVLAGISAVAGNAGLADVGNNILSLLAAVGHPGVPVALGAAAPLTRPLSRTGWPIHGADGLWGQGARPPQDLRPLSHDVAGL